MTNVKTEIRSRLSGFKPNLFPNDKPGEFIDWRQRILNGPLLMSVKYDGIRCENVAEGAFSRSLKLLPSVQLQNVLKNQFAYFKTIFPDLQVIEQEIIIESYNLEEIKHFVRSEDVTSLKNEKKYKALWKKTNQGTELYPAMEKGKAVWKAWPFPGRTLDWTIKDHSDQFSFAIFDILTDSNIHMTKKERYYQMLEKFELKDSITVPIGVLNSFIVEQHIIGTSEKSYIFVMSQFQDIIDNGGEGVMLQNPDSKYKFGRYTSKSGDGYKMKAYDEYSALAIKVNEGTKASEGTERTKDAFGRSKTSQLKEDREPSGKADTVTVEWQGRELDLMLQDFTHTDRAYLLKNPNLVTGRILKFHAMAPTKEGGMPRHAVYKKDY